MNKDILKGNNIRDLSDNELVGMVLSYKKELFNLRFQKTLGEITNTSRFSIIRKNIACVNTELNQRKNNAKKNS